MKIVVVWWNDDGIKYARLVEIGYTTIFLDEFQMQCENMTFHDSVEGFIRNNNLSDAEKKNFLEYGTIQFNNWK